MRCTHTRWRHRGKSRHKANSQELFWVYNEFEFAFELAPELTKRADAAANATGEAIFTGLEEQWSARTRTSFASCAQSNSDADADMHQTWRCVEGNVRQGVRKKLSKPERNASQFSSNRFSTDCRVAWAACAFGVVKRRGRGSQGQSDSDSNSEEQEEQREAHAKFSLVNVCINIPTDSEPLYCSILLATWRWATSFCAFYQTGKWWRGAR